MRWQQSSLSFFDIESDPPRIESVLSRIPAAASVGCDCMLRSVDLRIDSYRGQWSVMWSIDSFARLQTRQSGDGAMDFDAFHSLRLWPVRRFARVAAMLGESKRMKFEVWWDDLMDFKRGFDDCQR